MAIIDFKAFVQNGWANGDPDFSTVPEHKRQKKIKKFYEKLQAGADKKQIENTLHQLGVCGPQDELSKEDWDNLSALRTLAETSFCPGPSVKY